MFNLRHIVLFAIELFVIYVSSNWNWIFLEVTMNNFLFRQYMFGFCRLYSKLCPMDYSFHHCYSTRSTSRPLCSLEQCAPDISRFIHDDVIEWKHFPRYWPFVRGIYRSLVNSLHKGQWRRALMFPLICAWINGWVNNCAASDLRCYRAHYDVIVMFTNIEICSPRSPVRAMYWCLSWDHSLWPMLSLRI